LLLRSFKAVIADIFTDDGAVFLLDKAVVVFLVVAASGEGDAGILAPAVALLINSETGGGLAAISSKGFLIFFAVLCSIILYD
jgi:hypothetical protein